MTKSQQTMREGLALRLNFARVILGSSSSEGRRARYKQPVLFLDLQARWNRPTLASPIAGGITTATIEKLKMLAMAGDMIQTTPATSGSQSVPPTVTASPEATPTGIDSELADAPSVTRRRMSEPG